ncbi:apolipophorin-3-like [Ctenocephalides felis]|uniref:apolipophorin-3-like n=1 Tax=Ctenocephalides felis TaxID=7515 RepID=UPI000E6E4B66|nr:apolipophorin-3-like [Ctenocephalides felis]
MVPKFALVCLVACAFVQVALCDAPTDSMQLPSLQEVKDKADEALNNVQTEFHKLVGVQNNEELVKKISDGTDQLKDTLSNFLGKLNTEVNEHGKGFKDLLASVTTTFNEKVRELEQQHPDVKKQADEVKAKFQETLQTVVNEAGKLTKELGKSTEGMNEQLSNLTKEVLTQAQAVAADVRSSVDKFAKEHEATHTGH